MSGPLTHIHTTKIGNVRICVIGHIYIKTQESETRE